MSTTELSTDPRITRTRNLLKEAFFELLEEKTFHAVTVQEITERATVNRSTFYAHFDDKYGLLDDAIRRSFQEVLDRNLAPDTEFSLENCQVLIVATFQYLRQLRGLRRQSSSEQFEPLVEGAVQDQIHHFVSTWFSQFEKDDLDPRAVPEVLASSVSWAIFGAGLRWSQNCEMYPVEDAAHQVLSLITEGIYGSLNPQ
jgi:AcrR family transcriptional regulator